MNTQGSARAKKLVLAGDYDGLVDLARAQMDEGAHCLDVCVATTERSDEKEFMVNLVKRISIEVGAPLVIDSTDPDVVEAAVRQTPGRPMINSINLEGDGSRFRRLAPVMARYGVPAVALCIGPDGMAKTPEQKLRTAELICDAGKEYGLGPERFVFDVLTFTLATGEAEFADAGVRTLEGISLVKERFPESGTVLGLSNISFGLRPPARRAVNSVFLHHAVRRGLDCAIVNAREMVPYGDLGAEERRLAEDLVLNRGQDALAGLIEHFESAAGGSGSSGGRGSAGPEVDPSWDAGRRAAFRVVNRLKDGIAADVVEAIAEKISKKGSLRRAGEGPPVLDEPPSVTHGGAIRTLNEDLLPAMKVVGDKFGSGELILPFVLKSAECMKAAVAELEKYLLKEAGSRAKGVVVLGTVYGDVHDIGKNLVKTILENNGYEVHDLGKQVPVQAFVDKIAEVGPDAVGLSALLVSTSKQMQLFVEHARSSGMDVPVLCGGAAINGQYISRIARDGGIYGPGVFYCNTMFEGLKTMDALVDPARRGALLSEWRGRLEKWKDPLERAAAPAAPRASRGPAVRPASPPAPPSLGEPIRLGAAEIPMGEVWPLLDRRSLFKLSWGLRGKAGRASEAEHAVLLDEWKGRVAAEGLFEPAAVYGYFSCRGAGNSLEVEDPAGGSVTFEFPRSSGPRALCLSDYFGGKDVVAFQAVTVGGVAFQAVTVGGRVTEVIDGWNAQDRYADAYYLHGLAVEAAEALAGWANARIASELGLGGARREAAGRRGPCLRYSWGYPSCPDVGQHRLVWRLLGPEKSGMTLTKSGQIVPEQSTAAMVVHHPDAEYFGA